jgi:methylenetetrahydrofolate dehydrogenase (NADP+)/methenyltetrahydrofolate cyclohydrolase
MAVVLDGKRVRDQILAEARPRVEQLRNNACRPPGLAVILAGNDPASAVYVKNKIRASRELGIHSETLEPPATTTTEELLAMVAELNNRDEIDGILVQLPLPRHVDAQKVLLSVAPEKDVDGFHPVNAGYLATGRPGTRPCTPAGIIELLHRYEVPIAGRRAVIVGRSDIVGKPMALLLLQENATVTVCHSKTHDLPAVCREGEILVAAIGKPGLIRREFIRPGAVVIDVGTTRVDGLLMGDVERAAAEEMASAYTPVPGGVGPLTIAMLMRNTIEAAERRCSRSA